MTTAITEDCYRADIGRDWHVTCPNLATTVMRPRCASRRMWHLGSVIGSNMFNLAWASLVSQVLGSATIPSGSPDILTVLIVWVMLGASLVVDPVCVLPESEPDVGSGV